MKLRDILEHFKTKLDEVEKNGGKAYNKVGDSYFSKMFETPVNFQQTSSSYNQIDNIVGSPNLTDGRYNNAFGYKSLWKNTTGNYNNAFGYYSLWKNDTGNYNNAFGNESLGKNTTGYSNNAFGYKSLGENTTGYDNNAFGYNSLGKNTTGNSNNAFGFGALQSNTTGTGNSAFGGSGLRENTSGKYNSTFGIASLVFNTIGSYNNAFGYYALQNNTTGQYNNAFGYKSLNSSNTGNYNSAFGNNSLWKNTTGNYNSAFGNDSLSNNVTFSNCTGIGYFSQVTGDNQVQLGNADTTTYVYGTVQNRSDARDKLDIKDTVLGLDFINKLRPVDYRLNYRESYFEYEEIEIKDEETGEINKTRVKKELENDGSKAGKRFHHGLIAQEVKEVIEETGFDFGGYQDHSVNGGQDVLSIGYDEFIAPLIKAVQELSQENKELREVVDKLKVLLD